MTVPLTWLRRLLPLVALVAVAVGSWTAAVAADQDGALPRPEPHPLAPVDPVLSARRVPRALQAPVAAAALLPRVDALLAASPPASCLVVGVDGRELVSRNPDVPLVPASNQKLLTTWAALRVLGPDHRFRTAVASDAPVEGGVLRGDLWLVGGGDPLLMTDPWLAQFEQGDQMVRTRFEDLADAIVAAGITEVQGTVVGDESRYDTQRTVPTWAGRLVEQDQAGPLSALLVNEGMEQYPARYVNRQSYVPSTDPAAHAAGMLATLLLQRGVAVGGPARAGAAPPGAAELAAVASPPLTEVLRGVNAWSNNTAAELLLKAIDHATGGAGTTAGGAAVAAAAAAEAGLPVQGLVANDGSGLDEGDRATCSLLHELLESSGPASVLASSLAIGGVDGTLRSRFAGGPAEGRVLAKTGSLRGVTALSGYVLSAGESEPTATFAYVANAAGGDIPPEVFRHQVPFIEALAAFPEAPAVADLGPRQPRPVS